ncbi:NUDIX domain-containing protein, partial [Patescibacteria group bacterium]|nr:NUDIX domain-containing protein [Patescibacteria group bacterium]
MHEQQKERPSVGVATVVVKEGKILVGRDMRKGNETYGVPGGHWETGESLKECAMREVKEESGVVCTDVTLISVYDFYREDKQKSYVSIGMKAVYESGVLTDQVEEGRMQWGWYTPEEALQLNLFAPDRVLLERYLSGIVYE